MKSIIDFIEQRSMLSHSENISEKQNFIIKGHTVDQSGAVDLGLPSGNLWATCNFGANKPEEIGGFYAWGELTTKNDYTWDTYKFGNPDEEDPKPHGFTKYSYEDNKQELDPEDDIVNKTLKRNWHIPSKKDIDELISTRYVDLGVGERYGMKGLIITSKINGNELFLPLAGTYVKTIHKKINERCLYMTRSLVNDREYLCRREWALEITNSSYDEDWDVVRRIGCQIRPVQYKN